MPLISRPEQLVNGVGGLLVELRENMRVGVHGHADLGMPEHFHDGPGRDALGEQEGGTSVSQVMQAELIQACSLA